MEDFLKGNFKVKNPILPDETPQENKKENHEVVAEELKKRALLSLGGSIIYIERKKLVWDGEADSQ